jgi:hypothetical protein
VPGGGGGFGDGPEPAANPRLAKIVCSEAKLTWSNQMPKTATVERVVTMKKVYRFVGLEEAKTLRKEAKSAMDQQKTPEALGRLLSGQVQLWTADPDRTGFGRELQDHTFTDEGGGCLGGWQMLVSFTDDIDKLKGSTDDKVQSIVRNAPYLIEFEVPNDAVIPGASELSDSEGEVVGPNNLAFAGLMTKFSVNPFLSKEKQEAAKKAWLASFKGDGSNSWIG